MTVEDYYQMYRTQEGLCAVCGEPEKGVHKSGKVFVLGVDHDHTTGLVRGLLCGPCNRAIGLMRDNPELLERAADYLRSRSK